MKTKSSLHTFSFKHFCAAAVIACSLGIFSPTISYAGPPQNGNKNCGNGTTPTGQGNGPGVPATGGSDPVNAITGDMTQTIKDLSVWGSVGKSPLSWTRLEHTRTTMGNHWFGDTEIRDNYQWDIADAGVNSSGQAILSIDYPRGDNNRFINTGTNTWESPAGVSDTLTQNGNDFYLQRGNGFVYHFQKLTDGSGATYYQMQGFKDSAQNQTTFTYDSGSPDHLIQVTGPTGRSIQITWGTVTANSSSATLLGQITSTPPDSTWSQLAVNTPAAYRYLWYQSADGGWGNVAEVEFDDASGAKLSGTTFGTPGSYNNQGNVAAKAFDGDTSTFFDAPIATGAVTGLDLGSGNTASVSTIKYYPRVGFAYRMYHSIGDPNTPYTTGQFWGSNQEPQVVQVITSVASYDPQGNAVDVVNYNYTTIQDQTLPDISYVVLSSVDYDDGTSGTLSYQQYFAGARPVESSFNEPRAVGFSRLKVLYNTGQAAVFGYVWQQQNPVTGDPILTLGATGGQSHNTAMYYGNGGVEHFSANGYGSLIWDQDTLGNATSYTFANGGAGYLTKKTDPLGRTWKYTRNSRGAVLTETLPDSQTKTWTRDSLDLPLTYTDQNGHTTTYTRDADHRVTKVTYPDSSSESYTYNSFGEVLTHTLRSGGTVTNTYDSTGLKQSMTDPLGHTTTYGYDAAGRVNSATNANSHTTTMTYSPRGLVTKITNPDGSTKTFTYDQYGDKLTVTNELGHTWTYTYDSFQRVTSMTDPLSRTTTYSYSNSNYQAHPSSITLPSGKTIAYTYDTEWRKTSQTVGTGADAATTSYAYDADGELTSVTDPKGGVTTLAYGPLARLNSKTDPLGNVTKWKNDSVGNLLTMTRPDGGVTTNTYDSMNRLLTTTDPKGEETTDTYNAAGNLTKVTDAKSNSYSFSYDSLNRRTGTTYPDGSQESWTYDPVGNMNTYTSRSSAVRTLTYNSMNRLTNAGWSDGTTPSVSYNYDAAGRLLSTNNGVSALSYSYDNANEELSETQNISGSVGGAKTFSYTYTADGQRASMTEPDGVVTQYAYTGRDQLAGVNDGSPLASYSYDANGGRLSKTLGNGTSTAYTYDAAERLTNLDNSVTLSGSASHLSFAYDLNKVSDVTSVTHANGKSDAFSYDAVDQVTGANYDQTSGSGASRTVGYNYDAVGNRTSLTDSVNGSTSYATNDLNQYTTVAAQVPQYDGSGNLSNINGWTYQYDAESRIISASKGTTTETFAYDARNRCVARTLNGTTTNYYFDNWRLTEEHDATGNETARYAHGLGANEILAKFNSSGAIYYAYDGLGSTVGLTDANGDLVEKYRYDIFGAVTISDASGNPLTASAYGNRFLFTGSEYLSELGLYNFRNRMYSQQLGRFLQTDPMRFAAGDINLYRYVGNNATSLTDIMGLDSSAQKPLDPNQIPDDLKDDVKKGDKVYKDQNGDYKVVHPDGSSDTYNQFGGKESSTTAPVPSNTTPPGTPNPSVNGLPFPPGTHFTITPESPLLQAQMNMAMAGNWAQNRANSTSMPSQGFVENATQGLKAAGVAVAVGSLVVGAPVTASVLGVLAIGGAAVAIGENSISIYQSIKKYQY